MCNLASICLPQYVSSGKFNFELLEKIVRRATRNLDRVIDVNYYPLPEAQHSNEKHRPVGLGVQGLADVFQRMELPYDDEALKLDSHIFETIYYAAVSESCEIAKEKGFYPSFPGSPASGGQVAIRPLGQDRGGIHDRYCRQREVGSSESRSCRARPSKQPVDGPDADRKHLSNNGELHAGLSPDTIIAVPTPHSKWRFYALLPSVYRRDGEERGLWTQETQEAVLRAQGESTTQR